MRINSGTATGRSISPLADKWNGVVWFHEYINMLTDGMGGFVCRAHHERSVCQSTAPAIPVHLKEHRNIATVGYAPSGRWRCHHSARYYRTTLTQYIRYPYTY